MSPTFSPSPRLRRRLRLLFLLVAGLGSARLLGAQEPDPTSLAAMYGHETWSRGLVRQQIRGIAQDGRGYLWLATDVGLARFDGVRFDVHRPPNPASPDSMPDEYALSVAVGPGDTVWVGTTAAGVTRYAGRRFTTYGAASGLPPAAVAAIAVAPDGTVWVAAGGRVYRRIGERFESVAGLEGVDVTHLAFDQRGSLWLASANGLLRWRAGRMEPVPLGGLATPRLPAVHVGRDGRIWVGTLQGLVVLREDATGTPRIVRTYTLRDGLRSTYVTGFAEQHDGTIWVGTRGAGVARLGADGRWQGFGFSEGLVDNNVLDLMVDREDNVWVGTPDGLTRLRRHQTATYHGAGTWLTSIIWSAIPSRAGGAWLGTGSDGVVRVKPDGTADVYDTDRGLPSNVIYTVTELADGSVWAGTRNGVARLEGNRFVDQGPVLGLPPHPVRAIHRDARGDLIVASDSGTWRVHAGRATRVPPPPGRASTRVNDLVLDGQQRVLLSSTGVLELTPTGLRELPMRGAEPPRGTMGLLPDTVGLWIGDFVRGLHLLRGDSLVRFTPERTGVSAEVLQIVDDGRGALWITSGLGLQRVAKSELLAWAADSSRTVHVRTFTSADGMRSHDFSKSGATSGGRAVDGTLWLPTTGGVVLVQPDAIRPDTLPPEVIVEQVTVDDAGIVHGDTVALSTGARRVVIHFTSPQLSSPGRARIWYRMEGVDTTWRIADPLDRRAAYLDLPRGTHRFQVRAENADGVPSRAPATLVLIARPPLWRNVSFWIAVMLVLAVIGWFAYRRSLARQAQRAAEAAASQKMEALGRFAGGIAHDFNNLLGVINGVGELARESIADDHPAAAELDDVIKAGRKATDLTRQLLAFSRRDTLVPEVVDLAHTAAETIPMLTRLLGGSITVEHRTPSAPCLVSAVPSQLEQVLMNLSLNARDAMPNGGRLTIGLDTLDVAGPLPVQVGRLRRGLHHRLTVRDTGAGMDEQTRAQIFEPFFTTKAAGRGTGLGLATVQRIVVESHGAIAVESTPGQGTAFIVYFPAIAPVESSA